MQTQKGLHVRLSHELWLFLKVKAAQENTSMVKIIEKSIARMKNYSDKNVLTEEGTDV